jgi:hypothetical protein
LDFGAYIVQVHGIQYIQQRPKYNNLDILLENGELDQEMDAKLNSKTHFERHFEQLQFEKVLTSPSLSQHFSNGIMKCNIDDDFETCKKVASISTVLKSAKKIWVF